MDWFKFRMDWCTHLLLLSPEEAGRVVQAMAAYMAFGDELQLEGRENLMLRIMLQPLKEEIRQFQEAVTRNDETRAKRKEIARKGAQARWKKAASGSSESAAPIKNKNKKENKNTEKDSEKEKEKDPDAEEEFFNCCPEPSPEDSGPPAAEIPLNDHTVYPVSREEMETFAKLYPAVDVPQALRNIQAWCMSNPERRKTRRGVMRFINTWLAREQNRGRPGGSPEHSVPVNPFLEELKKMEQQDPEAQAPGFIFYGGEEIS